jgi:hypothetical protein
VVGACVVSAAACRAVGADEQATAETLAAEGRLAPAAPSMVRVVNALPGDRAVALDAGGAPFVSGVDYKAVSPYTPLHDPVDRLTLRAGAGDTTHATIARVGADGARYTLVALPDDAGGMRLQLLHDSLAPTPGQVRVRVVHALRGAGAVDVLLRGRTTPVFDDVAFGAGGTYIELAPDTTRLELRASATGRVLLRKELTLRADHAYTIVVAGDARRRVDAVIIDDTMEGGR